MKRIILFSIFIILTIAFIPSISKKSLSSSLSSSSSSSSTTTIFNPIRDVDPDNAPPIGEHLSFSNTKILAKGGTINFGSKIPEKSVVSFPTSDYYPFQSLIDSEKRIGYFYSGGTYAFANDTHGFSTYFDSNFSPVCYRISSFSYDTFISGYESLYRIGSFSASFEITSLIHDTIKDLYHNENRSCIAKYGASTIDIYRGEIFDIGLPGPHSGCQKERVSYTLWVSRAIKECYGQVLVVQWNYQQFYPFLSYWIDTSNIIMSDVIISNFSSPSLSDFHSISSVIDTLCQDAPDYSTFINSDCAYPSLPNISCN